MRLSVIVIFYNMRREAEHTLYSLTRDYQRGIDQLDYEVIAIDNGSSQPLDPETVTKFGNNFHYQYVSSEFPSPCRAINEAVRNANGQLVMCCIDGARILSPGILRSSLVMSNVYQHPFVFTLGMHIGNKPQNELVEEGYSREMEDEFIASVDWRRDGYRLFDISCLATSSNNGYFALIHESNCFLLRKDDYFEIGGYDEAFTSPGGGICNLDIFKRANMSRSIAPIMLLGEATFHQFHGGVATNAPANDHPFWKMFDEYTRVKGEVFKPLSRGCIYFGELTQGARKFL